MQFLVKLFSAKQTVDLEFQASSAAMDKMHKDEAMKTTYHEDTTSTDGSSTDEYDPWNPPYPPCPPGVGNSLSDSIRLVAKVQ